MRVYTTKCDKCGRVIKDDEKLKSAHVVARQISGMDDVKSPVQPFYDAHWAEHNSIDLCPECWYDLGQFVFGKK